MITHNSRKYPVGDKITISGHNMSIKFRDRLVGRIKKSSRASSWSPRYSFHLATGKTFPRYDRYPVFFSDNLNDVLGAAAAYISHSESNLNESQPKKNKNFGGYL